MNVEVNSQQVTEIDLSEVESAAEPGGESLLTGQGIGLIQDLPVKLNVVLGDLELSVQALYGLKVGQVVKLDTSVDQPIKLMFEQQLIAHGVLIAVDDHYGIEITQMTQITA